MTRLTSARAKERGSVLGIVLVVLIALLAGGMIALYVSTQDVRSAGVVRQTRTALYCAEAGLSTAQRVFETNISQWPLLIDTDASNDPAWYPLQGDIDGDGTPDFEVRAFDNEDDAPAANNPNLDQDLKIFIVSRCLNNPETPRAITALIGMSGTGHNYRSQAGCGAGHTGNCN